MAINVVVVVVVVTRSITIIHHHHHHENTLKNHVRINKEDRNWRKDREENGEEGTKTEGEWWESKVEEGYLWRRK